MTLGQYERWFCFAGHVAKHALLIAAVAFVTTAAHAAEPASEASPPKATDSIDEQLSRDLDNELLEGTELAPEKVDDGDGQRSFGTTDGDDPLAPIVRQMREAEALIGKQRPADLATQVQRQIVTDLERLIKQLEQRRQQSSASQSSAEKSQTAQRNKVNQPNQPGTNNSKNSPDPARDSETRVGKSAVEAPDLASLKEQIKDLWGHLPARAREEVLQHPPEKFLPQYETQIEKYYRRLAERQNRGP